MNLQQTPNPAAQFPDAVPPAVVHSELARQVPKIVAPCDVVQTLIVDSR